MNCSVHQNVVAVAQCGDCSVGMCSDCVDVSEYKIDNKPICRQCNFSTIHEFLASTKKEKVMIIVKLAINAFFLIAGAIVFSKSPENGFILFAIGGIPTAWKMLTPSAHDKFRNSVNDAVANHNEVGGGLMNSLFRFIFRIIFTVLIGGIAAPILLIVNIVKLVKANKKIEQNEQLLGRFA